MQIANRPRGVKNVECKLQYACRHACSSCKHKALSKTFKKSEFAIGCSRGSTEEEKKKKEYKKKSEYMSTS
jgi:hypothetical protein